MIRRAITGLVLAAAAFAWAPVSTARAETQEIDAITVGAMTESASIVVVLGAAEAVPASGEGVRSFRFRVEEAIRGGERDAVIRVDLPESVALAAAAPGGRFLAFLRATPADTFVPVSTPYGFRPLAETGVKPLADYARGFAACLAASGEVKDTAAFAELLVAGLESSASGVPFCAGRDLVRHAEVWPALTAPQRDRVAAALAAPRKADDDLTSIILAAGRVGGSATDAALVTRLLDPAVRNLRRHVVEALSNRATPELAATLAARIDAFPGDAGAPRRADLANALGRLALRAAEAPLLRLVADDAAEVRLEAAHSLGLLARDVRALRDAAPGAAEAPRVKLDTSLAPIVTAFERATSPHERRALLWAAAQIDIADAWSFLRRTAKEHAEPRVREIAQQYLDRPRVGLLLE
jgi:hypothetical protein